MKIRILSLTILFIQCVAWSQTVKGIVTNTSNQPIKMVSIANSATHQHVHTNAEGAFTMQNVNIGDVLEFSHVSYQEEEWKISSFSDTIRIQLVAQSVQLEEVVISPRLNALEIITDIDITANPVNSSQDVLRKVPGLFIGQHAGGGKAEQMFIRGFDIDHGTDVAITVDGLPVNMVSHAHGHGYADLHFVIPETIQKIDFGKGPYNADKGNFATAAYVNFNTKNRLDNNSIKLEFGQFNTQRLFGAVQLIDKSDQSAYVASEFLATDGPFESPQNFSRVNLFTKYTQTISPSEKWGFTASHFTSQWDASGQIPQRAVDSGLISRFGAIDDTEGGTTSRTNVVINYDKKINEDSSIKNTLFWSAYDFELFSNFTFFLEDPINADQIKQYENRTIYGLNSTYQSRFKNNQRGDWQAGISLRKDAIQNNELSRTLNRKEVLENIRLGDIQETNFGAFASANFELGNWVIHPAIRVDYFDFNYTDALSTLYNPQSETKAIFSPKLNILYNPSQKAQLYLKTGKGFHSNDSRGVVADTQRKTLPAAYGLDVGGIWKPNPKMLLNVAYWYLFLEQEFVYVGDAGIVEPSGKTQRSGLDLSYRYQPVSWLYWNIDANYTLARSTEEPKGEDYIPLAPDFTLSTGFNVQHPSGWYAGFNLRHLGDRPANEDNSIVAEGYTVSDAQIGYQWKHWNLGIQVQNIFDTEWNETQFATESRLQNEVEPVEEIHFTPGTPFFIKTVLEYRF